MCLLALIVCHSHQYINMIVEQMSIYNHELSRILQIVDKSIKKLILPQSETFSHVNI